LYFFGQTNSGDTLHAPLSTDDRVRAKFDKWKKDEWKGTFWRLCRRRVVIRPGPVLLYRKGTSIQPFTYFLSLQLWRAKSGLTFRRTNLRGVRRIHLPLQATGNESCFLFMFTFFKFCHFSLSLSLSLSLYQPLLGLPWPLFFALSL
jgi:hypothetical protein